MKPSLPSLLTNSRCGLLLNDCRRPNRIVESSMHRADLYWFTQQYPLSEFEWMQKRHANFYREKRAMHELSTVMRLPGFINHKAGGFLTSCFDPG